MMTGGTATMMTGILNTEIGACITNVVLISDNTIVPGSGFWRFFFSEEHVSHIKFKDFPNAIHIEAYATARDNKRQTCVYN